MNRRNCESSIEIVSIDYVKNNRRATLLWQAIEKELLIAYMKTNHNCRQKESDPLILPHSNFSCCHGRRVVSSIGEIEIEIEEAMDE